MIATFLDVTGILVIGLYTTHLLVNMFKTKKLTSPVKVYSDNKSFWKFSYFHILLIFYIAATSLYWVLNFFKINDAVMNHIFAYVFPVFLMTYSSNPIIFVIGKEGILYKNKVYEWDSATKIEINVLEKPHLNFTHLIACNITVKTVRLTGFVKKDDVEKLLLLRSS